jgi:hypothetical protein
MIFKRGDLVQTYFDTGAFGAKILYGRIVKAGPKTATIEWESRNRNRIEQSPHVGVKLAEDQEDAARALNVTNVTNP